MRILGERIIFDLEFVTGVFILIFSYTLGLIIAFWSGRGAAIYIRSKGRYHQVLKKGGVSHSIYADLGLSDCF